MKLWRLLAGLPVALVLLLTIAGPFTSPLQAQAAFGSIVGTVTDHSGAFVPGATVTLTDTATNEKQTVQSNSAGEYRFESLVPSLYTVEVQKSSFKSFLREQTTVEVSTITRVDAVLQVGSVSELVEVSTASPLLQTETGTLGTVIEGETVTEMPLNGRNIMNLLSLAPGVVPGTNAQGSTVLNAGGHTQIQGWDNYEIGGGLNGQSAFYVDGQPLNVLGSNTVGYVPTQDAVQEFSVASNSVSAEYGRFAGGVVNMSTKSGTNSWHGSAYEFLRNNIFNSNEFFNKQAELQNGEPNKRTQFDQNQYGVTFGGPIKKNRAFFFFSWENFVARTSANNAANVPTPDMQAGWIDATSSTGGGSGGGPGGPGGPSAVAVSNAAAGQSALLTYLQTPTVTPLGTGAPCAAATLGTSPSGVANSVLIPSTCWDPTAAVIKTEYPGPLNPVPNENFNKDGSTGSNTGTYTGRVDYTVSAKQRLFTRYTHINTADLSQEAIPGGVCPASVCGTAFDWHIGGGATHVRAQSIVVGDTYTFNSSTILDARLSYLRSYNDQVPDSAGLDMGVYGGEWPSLQKEITIRNDVQVGFGNDANISSFRGNNQISYQWNDNDVLSLALTKIVGKHSLTLGIEDRFMDRSILQGSGNSETSGDFTFGYTYFAPNSWASFLLGLPESGTITTTRETGAYNWYQGYYVNDSWQANRKLTVTAGLRWELPGNIKEKNNRMTELLPTTTDPVTGAYGTLVLVDSGLYPDNGSEPARHDLFSPRLGFAYRITDNDVLRGGYAFDVAPPDIQTGLFPDSDSINVNNTSWNAPNATYTLANPFPTSVPAYANGIPQPLGRTGYSTNQFLGQNVSAPLPQLKFPYTEQWNLSLSHQFRSGWMIEVAYAASVATHLPMSGYNYNELAPGFWADQTVPTPATCGAGMNWQFSNTTLGQCDRPHPAYLNFADAVANLGSSNYNSLPVRVEKRFKSRGLVTASYTFSKRLGNTEGASANQGGAAQDYYNPRAEYAISSNNAPQRLVISYVLNAPFGRGQRFLANLHNGVVQNLVSGWSVNGITTFQDGLPLGLSASYPQSMGRVVNVPDSYGGGTLRPNYVEGCKKTVGGSYVSHVLAATPVLNPACWSAPVAPTDYTYHGVYYATTFGNESRVDSGVHVPDQANWDFAAVKATKLKENVSLEFRFEFFNLFNRVQFGAPATGVPVAQGFGGATPFGIINGSSLYENSPREGQASLRLNF